MSEDDVARYRRPPRRGQFKPGQSGNPNGRPKNSRNIKTHVERLLSAPIEVIDNGKKRKISRAEAIATQLVNLAAKGDPKGLAAVMALTKDHDEAIAETRSAALERADDSAVLDGILERIRSAGKAVAPLEEASERGSLQSGAAALAASESASACDTNEEAVPERAVDR